MNAAARNCEGPSGIGIGRRELIRFGFGGLGLAELSRQRSLAAAPPDTALIIVWLHGGVTHLETWDPKPDAPVEYRGPFGAINTSVSGLQFSELLPRQAALAHRMSVIRSVVHRGICHQQGLQTLMTGKEQLVLKNKAEHPDCTCVIGHHRQPTTRRLPANVGMPPLPYGGAAYLGAGEEAFVVSGDPNQPTFQVPNIAVADKQRPRLERRVRLLQGVDSTQRALWENPEIAARDRHYHAAVEMVTGSEARSAFSLEQESAATRDRYGRTRWGQQLLLARRLVEAGVSVVTCSFFQVEKGVAGSFDDHAVNWDCFQAQKERAPVLDQSVAALIRDLHDRGLDRKVMVVVTGEFGRTPKISHVDGKAGRDHWPYATSLLVSGGGLRMGEVIGATDSRGEYVVERPVSPNDLLATIYRHMGIDPERHLVDHSGRPVAILDRKDPIPELV